MLSQTVPVSRNQHGIRRSKSVGALPNLPGYDGYKVPTRPKPSGAHGPQGPASGPQSSLLNPKRIGGVNPFPNFQINPIPKPPRTFEYEPPATGNLRM